VYTLVIGIRDDSDLDWNKRDRVIGDPLGVGLARSDSGASDSGSGGCSAGATGVLAALAVLAAAFRARRKGR
jgi:Synergist-CTERM protein sorting domain-containing protein